MFKFELFSLRAACLFLTPFSIATTAHYYYLPGIIETAAAAGLLDKLPIEP